jgi:hypothetical protein
MKRQKQGEFCGSFSVLSISVLVQEPVLEATHLRPASVSKPIDVAQPGVILFALLSLASFACVVSFLYSSLYRQQEGWSFLQSKNRCFLLSFPLFFLLIPANILIKTLCRRH